MAYGLMRQGIRAYERHKGQVFALGARPRALAAAIKGVAGGVGEAFEHGAWRDEVSTQPPRVVGVSAGGVNAGGS
eukprot:1116824-Rhodomonas_salina.1